MNGFILKMIEKNTKPPLWKRLYVPGGITFTQLSFILNEMFFLQHGDSFGFEFFSCKHQISEKGAYQFKGYRWQYSQRNADSTYIDDYLISEPWFSFYRKTDKGDRAFRVEIEECIPSVDLYAPQVMKAVTKREDTAWREIDINAYLRELYTVTYREEPAYLTHAQLCDAAENKDYHFIGCSKPESAPMESKDMSFHEMIDFYLSGTGIRETMQRSAGVNSLREEFLRSNTGLEAKTENKKKKYYQYWLEQCDYAVGKLYGACPEEVFCRMCRANTSIHLTDEKIMALYRQMPEESRYSVMHGGKIVTPGLLENGTYKNLLGWHKDVGDFYIPSEEEIKDLYDVEYPKSDPSYQRARRLLQDRYNVDFEDACEYLCTIFDAFSYGNKTDGVVKKLDEEGLRISGARAAGELVDILNEISVSTRRAVYKGNRLIDQQSYWNPSAGKEWKESGQSRSGEAKHRQNRGKSEERSAEKSSQSVRTGVLENGRSDSVPVVNISPKIYPNDPCPCGSGKKYKKCCGRM